MTTSTSLKVQVKLTTILWHLYHTESTGKTKYFMAMHPGLLSNHTSLKLKVQVKMSPILWQFYLTESTGKIKYHSMATLPQWKYK